jgi:hypothetical protein
MKRPGRANTPANDADQPDEPISSGRITNMSTTTAKTTIKIAGFDVHPYANEYPLMKDCDPEGFERTKNDIKANGLTERIEIIIEDGKHIIIDGRNRAQMLDELGIKIDPDQHMQVKRFSRDEALRRYIDSKNLHRRQLTKDWINTFLVKLMQDSPDKSDHAIAEEATKKGVKTNHKKVGRERKKGERRGTAVPRQKVVDTKGRQQPATKPPKPKDKLPVPPPKPSAAPAKPVAASVPEQPRPEELDALRSFVTFTIMNVDAGELKLTGNPERMRRWEDLRARVAPFIKIRV